MHSPHSLHNLQSMQLVNEAERPDLLSAEQVESMLGVDKSTVYRMAQDGRLTAIKVGRQWRFPAEPIQEMLGVVASPISATPSVSAGLPPVEAMQSVLDLAAELLGVMMVVTDMHGEPITEVANPCPWFAERAENPEVLDACTADWRGLADDPNFEPSYRVGPHGFECARGLIRRGNHLIGMVLAGGLAPEGDDSDGLYHLDAEARAKALAALPRVASTISRIADTHA